MVDAPGQTAAETPSSRAQRRLRKGVFVVPSLLTTGNIFCGFYSVTESLAGAQALSLGDVPAATEHFDRAAVNIGVAYLFDALDGRIARMTGATTDFGVELDSIADVLSFGIAPAILAYTWGYGPIAQIHTVAWGASLLYLVCGALRLARFNVHANQPHPKQQSKPLTDKKAFVGMPIPAGAGLLAAIVHFLPQPLFKGAVIAFGGRTLYLDPVVLGTGLLILVVCLALLMVSTLRYSSLKGGGAGKYHPRILILLITLLVLTIWFYSRWSLLILASVYVTHGVVVKAWSLLRPRNRPA
jgi:CDP-diacylglycerol--serine O-phosphatidyltransferase